MNAEMETGPETVRLDKAIRPRLVRLARELGKEPALFFNECAAAVAELIEETTPAIPHLVRLARLAREQNATYLDPKTPFPASASSKRVIRESTRLSASSSTDEGGAQQKSKIRAEAKRSGDRPK